MTRDALWFEELRIRRMAGFETEGFTLSALSPGINLVHGPNGSGKSTSARALERLLWPRLAGGERIAVAGRFRLLGEEWEVEVDGSRVAHRRAGVETAGPALPSMEEHHRYRLSLHDLLHERDESFARAIIRESAGGYDVPKAGAVLAPRSGRPTRAAGKEELDRARATWERAVAAQRELREDERLLIDLRKRKEEADRALVRVGDLEEALKYATARETELHARMELKRFPAGMERVGGKEYAGLCQLRERLKKTAADLEATEKARREALGDLEAAGIPDADAGEEVVRGLAADLDSFREAERTIAALERHRAAAAARLHDERVRIGSVIEEDRLAALDSAAMGELAGFASRAGEAAATGQVLRAELTLLGAETSGEEDPRLAEGISLLQRWLREPGPPQSPAVPRAGMAAAALLILLGFALGAQIHPGYLVLALAGGILLFLQLGSRRDPAAAARAMRQRDYASLGIEGPPVWEPAAVETLLDALLSRAAAARNAAERDLRRRDLLERLRRHLELEREIEGERSALAARLGVEPGLDAAALAWLTERVSRWQGAHSEVAAAERELAAAVVQAEKLATGLRARLERLGFRDLGTTGALAGAVVGFQQRREARDRALQAIANADKEAQRLGRAQEEYADEVGALFVALSLDSDADETVREWCARHAEYVRAREAHRDAGIALREAHSRLAARGCESLAELLSVELELELAAEREIAARRDPLAHQISRTEVRIDQAKASHDMEEALQGIERAEETLRRSRERDLRGVVASELIAYLEGATRDQHLPPVYRRARELFTRITHGRYELRLVGEGEVSFSAFDNEERRVRALEELSSGSRVQLLIAVRVAFVEQQEAGVKLPLFLDEVLGNSDDQRARAIMEAVVELAREGRQIFYFTAQEDEIARWRAMVGEKEAAVLLREIDLRAVRRLERALEIPPIVPVGPRLPPAPDGMGHQEYGRRLAVPGIERTGAEPGGVHLWYLVEEPESLHQLLRLGPERWGALDAFARDGGHALVDQTLFTRLSVYGRALEAFLEAARVGVGLRVDRTVLEESGAVTSTFLDRVDELARSLDGDAARLQEALEEGAVPRFPRAAKERLREYLEEHGYCPQDVPLSREEVRTRVLSRVAADLAGGQLDMEAVDRLLDRLWLGIGGE